MESIPGYDEWKTSPPESKPAAYCTICGDELYEGDVLYTIDGGICEACRDDRYGELAIGSVIL